MEPINTLMYIYAFMVGCCVASFINVVIDRMSNQLSVAKGRSFCFSCNKKLKWYDLLPIVSWLFLKGKCRYCKTVISIRYPCIEIVGGIIGVFCFYQYHLSWMTGLSFSIAMTLLAITMIDIDTMIIPNQLVIIMAIFAILSYFINPTITLTSRIIGMFCVSGFMLLVSACITGAFGGGDIKLMFVIGFLLGLKNILLTFFIAVIIAGIYAAYLLITKSKTRKQHIAFGPYLCIGTFLVLVYGSTIIEWYRSLFIIV